MGKARLFSQLIAGNGTIKAAKLGADVPITENVATTDNLPSSASIGEQAFVEDTNRLYIWNGSGWYNIALINTTPTWDSGGQPLSLYALDADSPQAATVITLAASDPEGLPVSYSYVTSGSMDSMATISQDSSVFTITPKTVEQVGEGAELTGSITFRASDGVNILPQVSSFALSFVTIVENSKYTTLLVTAIDTSDNNNITDSSTNNHTITVNGDAQAGTFSPYRHGGYSTYFDGTGDYIRYTDASLAEGTDDFTVEFWLKRDGSQGLNDTVVGHDTTPGWQICFNTSNNLQFMTNAGDASRILSTGTLNDQQWYHVVYQRSSGTLQGFLDGVSLGTATVSDNFTNNIIEIGVNRGGSSYFHGHVRDVRIIKGTAFYSSSGFDVPTESLTAVSGTGYSTTLLSCHLPYIADGGANSLTPTINGNTSTKPFTPYDFSKYTESNNGGSIYFDGSDYCTITDSEDFEFGSGDFTVECWVYMTAYEGTGFQMFLHKGGNNSNAWHFDYKNSTAELRFLPYVSNVNTSITATTTLNLNQWYHVAAVRNGNTIVLYKNGKAVSSTAYSLTIDNTADAIHIGQRAHLNDRRLTGYLSDIRINKSAVYTSDFTVPTSPVSSAGSTLHLKGTDASIIDKSQASNLKLVGNTTGSTTQVKFADTKSMYFDGTGDYVTISDLELSGDLTIEGWFYQSVAQSATFRCLTGSSTYTSPGSTPLRIYTNGSDVRAYVTSTTYISGSFTANSWFHVALVRSSGTWTLYIDGVSVGTSTTSGAYNFASNTDWYIGASGPDGYPFTGYSQDVRFSNGLARYTANFTPPTKPFKG